MKYKVKYRDRTFIIFADSNDSIMNKLNKIYDNCFNDTSSILDASVKDDDVLYLAVATRGDEIREFTNYNALLDFSQSSRSVNFQFWKVPKKEYKQLKQLRNSRFAFNRLHGEHKTTHVS